MADVYLTTKELARRWNMAPQTLDSWRAKGKGPKWIKLGPKMVRYRLADVEVWEKASAAGTGQ